MVLHYSYFIIQIERLSYHTDPNIMTTEGNTPLIQAVKDKNIKKAGLLLCRGANPELANNKGLTPVDYGLRLENGDVYINN